MAFNVMSKNNIGYASTLLIIVLLSQSRFFNFLIDTTLGRSVLILFILLISYTHKILGVVVVLFIIIMFNNSDIGYIEGFTDSTNTQTPSSTNTTNTTSSTSSTNNDKLNTKKNTDISKKTTTSPDISNNFSSVTPSSTNNDTTTTTASSSATSGVAATEGFDIVGKERWIQKGKQSNQIPVNDFMRESPDVSPFEGGFFSEKFTSY